jgi:hypothetical protein
MCYAQYWYLLIQYDRFSFYLLHWKRYRALQHYNAWYPETSGSTTMTMVLGFLPTPFVTVHVTKVLLVSYNTCKNGVWIGVPGSSLNKSFGQKKRYYPVPVSVFHFLQIVVWYRTVCNNICVWTDTVQKQSLRFYFKIVSVTYILQCRPLRTTMLRVRWASPSPTWTTGTTTAHQ